MKWFQHSIGSHDDSDIADARDKFGDFGYSGFFIILEIYAEEFNHINDEQFIDISQTFLRRKLKKSWTNVRLLLDFYQTKNRICYKTEDERVLIKVPKFITLVDNWTRRPKDKNSVVKTEKLPNEKQDKRKQEKTREDKRRYIKEYFETFWAVYPIKIGKAKCNEKWKKINPDAMLYEKIISALGKQIQWRKNKRIDEFIPEWKHPVTWLNQKCWDDEIPEYVSNTSGIGSLDATKQLAKEWGKHE